MTSLHLVRTCRTVFMMLCIAYAGANASRELAIAPVQQSGTNVCWAACCQMTLTAYGIPVAQSTIINWAVGGQNVGNELTGRATAVDKVLEHYGISGQGSPIWSSYTAPNMAGYGNVSEFDLTYEIDAPNGRPIIAAWLQQDASEHVVLIKGYTGPGLSNSGSVIYNDPSDGARYTRSYAEFVRRGNEYVWRETLRLTTTPRIPIPTGVGDHELVWIDAGPIEVTPSMSSFSFSGHKSGSHTPTCWTWRLVFPHAGGYCTVASWTSPGSNVSSTWNVSGFSMPAGYQWVYNCDGKVPGRAEVSVDDNAGPPAHTDAMNVLYVPSVQYPAVAIYEDRTVFSPQSDVLAHELIIVRNDQLNTGTDIAFRSGRSIDIGDGITVQNGTATDFIADPALR